MANLSREKLTPDQIANKLSEVQGWRTENDVLTKDFTFDSYPEGALFVSTVAHLAQTLDHHPDIELGYQKAKVSMSTHDAGGLTDYDFELARRIDAIS